MGTLGRPTVAIDLSEAERETLERWARRPKSAQALALRCRIVLSGGRGEGKQRDRHGTRLRPQHGGQVAPPLRRARGWTASRTNPGRANPAPSPTPTWSGCS